MSKYIKLKLINLNIWNRLSSLNQYEDMWVPCNHKNATVACGALVWNDCWGVRVSSPNPWNQISKIPSTCWNLGMLDFGHESDWISEFSKFTIKKQGTSEMNFKKNNFYISL